MLEVNWHRFATRLDLLAMHVRLFPICLVQYFGAGA